MTLSELFLKMSVFKVKKLQNKYVLFPKLLQNMFQFVLYFEYFNLYPNKALLADVFNFESARAGVKWSLVLAKFPKDNFQESPSV